MRSALLVIDVQAALFDPEPRPDDADAVLQRVNQLAERARAAGAPVVWVQHERPAHALAHGSPGWALQASLLTQADDRFVRKTTPDSFLHTGLAEWLTAQGVDHLVLCGYASEFCVDTSARRAAAGGFAVTLAADAHTTHDKPHASAQRIRDHHNATLPGLTSFGPSIEALAADQVVFHQQTAEASADPVRSLAGLAMLYGQPGEASLTKESCWLTPAYRALLEASPFCVLATIGPEGLDASPRGDPAPLLVVQDEHTLLLPDRRGNQRLDSLKNLVHDPRLALLCLVPGTSETLRIQGRGQISTEANLCQRLAVEGKLPATVLVIHIESVYFQCARALLRSGLWQAPSWPTRSSLPSAGRMLQEASGGGFDGQAYDRALPQRQRDSLY